MKKLRIAMYFSSSPERVGGSQEHVYHLAQALNRRGHRVAIFGPEHPYFEYGDYHEVTRASMIPVPNGNWANFTIPISKNNISQFISNDFDIAHIHEPYIPFHAWEIMRAVTIPKIATFHSAWGEESILRILNSVLPFFQQSFCAHMHGVIYVSAVTARCWRPMSGDRVKQKIIGHGIDENFAPALLRQGNKRTITLLFLARLVPRKGLRYLMHALHRLVRLQPNVRLIVVGDGPERGEAQSLVKKLRLTRFVEFKGEVLGDKKITYYQSADIFCAPYQDEAYGMTILEAMACGCPIVGFANEAFQETLRNYPAPDLLVTPKDTSALTHALKKLVTSPDLRDKIGRWGVKESKKYSWDAVAQQTEEFYYQILESHAFQKITPRQRDARQHIRFSFPTFA